MINLAGRDILHSWGKFVLTGLGLGLLIGVTFTMAGVYRGMVDDAKALLNNSGADLWVVQKDTQGPYADVQHSRRCGAHFGMPGVGSRMSPTSPCRCASNREMRVMLVGFEPGKPGEPAYRRAPSRSHYGAGRH